MAYSFWRSSHYEQWLMEKPDIQRGRAEDLKIYTEEEYQKIMIFFSNMLHAIAQDPSSTGNNYRIRMQVVATACVYFKRFYLRRSFKDVDPFLMAPTCLLLAAKVEEFGTLSTNKLSSAVNGYVKKFPFLSVDLSPLRVGIMHEAEFILLEILDCCLIVFQPYRPLKQLFQDLRESNTIKELDTLEAAAVKIINDSIRTDLSLLYAPHIIAIGCFQLAMMFNQREKDFATWFAELNVDYDKVLDVVNTMTALYKKWQSVEDNGVLKGLIDKLPKVNPNPPPPSHHLQAQQQQQQHMLQQQQQARLQQQHQQQRYQ